MLLKVAYDGRLFHGSQIQPSVRTVESAIAEALNSIKVQTKERPRLLSRTDSRVSALGNILEIKSNGKFSLGELNSALPDDVVAWAISNDRAVLPAAKTYLYFLPGRHDVKRLEKAARLFSGRHDFSNFARVEEHKSPVRSIEVHVKEKYGLTALQFDGIGFLWQLVRRVALAMADYETSRIELSRLAALLDVKEMKPYSAGPAENLVLVNIDLGVTFLDDKILRNKAEEISLPRSDRRSAALRRI